MKLPISLLLSVTTSTLFVSCMAPTAPQAGGAGGTYQDPNNPYAVPGVTTQGGYAPAPQSPYQDTTDTTPYQPIPSVSPNPPASVPTYTPPATSTPTVSSSGGSHTVTSGDTLWGLSRKYNVSVDSIRQANGLTSDTIITGQTLNIPQ